jgi:biotin carboxylase
MLIDSLIKNEVDVDIILPSTIRHFDKVKKKILKYGNYRIIDNFRKDIKKICENSNYDLIFPSFTDTGLSTEIITKLNKKYMFSGLEWETYKRISNKLSYYNIWKNLSLPMPKIYDIISPYLTYENTSKEIKYPCLVKPSVGSGGFGIQVVDDENTLKDFFEDTDQSTSDFQEKNGNNFKKLQYLCNGGDYLIQEYVDGTVVSYAGHVYNEKITIDFIFDIGSCAYPYTAETELSYPSKFDESFLRERTLPFLEKFFKEINLDNSAFMIDIIVDKEDKIYFIDFSPRISVNPLLLMLYSGESDYGYKLTNKLLNGIDFKMDIKKAVLFRSLPFEQKDIEKIIVKKEYLAEHISLPEGKIQLLRNDLDVYNNGYAIFVGNDRYDTEEKYREFTDNLQIIYS